MLEVSTLLEMKILWIVLLDLVYLDAVLDLQSVDQEVSVGWELHLVVLEEVVRVSFDQGVLRLQEVEAVEVVVADASHDGV